MKYLEFESHKKGGMLTVWKCLHCGQTFAVGDDKELHRANDGSSIITKAKMVYSIEPLYCPMCGKSFMEEKENI